MKKKSPTPEKKPSQDNKTIHSKANDDWRKELELLLLRHAGQGAHYDIASMIDAELWVVPAP